MSETIKKRPLASNSSIRPSASVIVVNSRNEVLMVHRNAKGTFAKAHVFPGGNVDSDQDDSFVTTAVREAFEETGLLLVSPDKGKLPSDSDLDAARDAIHSRKLMFKDFLNQHGLSIDERSLLPFTQWVTPPMVPRRFHTHFYVAFLNAIDSAGFSSGHRTERLPTPDKGQEVVAARFVHPLTAIQEFRAQKIALVPPQFYLLTTLAEILQGHENTVDQRTQVERLATGPFGRMIINPKRLQKEVEGRTVLTYEGDETRGGPPGRLHRSSVIWQKNGVAADIKLQRNFDIFTEVEEYSVQTAKL
ncbi:hypothetical protein QCA50_003599 [Cerrena zonata]|uniref:Nudix hydrolase domain-containing protein n=1 Tax=Cerrena zonata TaxID=2478898 RepID=A0AAW0GUB4_9APHY